MRRIALCTLVLAVVVSSGAFAKNGLYVGGSIGQTYVELDTDTPLEIDDEDFAYKIFVGYRAASFFAVEGGFRDLGQVKDEDGMSVLQSESTAFDAAGVGMLKLGIVDIFGKVGLVAWDTEVSFNGVELPEFSDSGTNGLYGLGVQVRLGGLGIRLEYELLDVDQPDDLSMLSLGVSWTF